MDFITSKKGNSQGQLDKIDSLGKLITPTTVCEIQGKTNERIDCNIIALIVNQYENTEGVLDLASHNLVFSSGIISKKLCEEFYSKVSINLQEKISTDFISNSILYYNASFDYIKVLLRFVYSSYVDLKGNYPESEVRDTLKELGLEKTDWYLALGFLITKTKDEDFKKWLRESSNIPEDIWGCFNNLKGKNKKLKKDYQANQLKHGAVPHFMRSNSANTIGSRVLITLDDFYSKSTHTISYSLPGNSLDIEDTQNFLIKYNNATVKLINKVRKDIKIIEK